MIVIGILLFGEGIFATVAGLQMPFWEFAIQCALSVALIRVGAGRMIEL
jgi:hypothetical protein